MNAGEVVLDLIARTKDGLHEEIVGEITVPVIYGEPTVKEVTR